MEGIKSKVISKTYFFTYHVDQEKSISKSRSSNTHITKSGNNKNNIAIVFISFSSSILFLFAMHEQWCPINTES